MYFKPVTILEVDGDINRTVEQYRKGDVVEVYYLGSKKSVGKVHSVGGDSIELDVSKRYSSNIIKILYADMYNIIRHEEEE
ncbi:MAG: hypothetical protein ACRDD7_06340 [Peptostreptococcaceae bacterium]